MLIFWEKMLTSAKLRRSWYQKVYFLKLNMLMYLHTEFQVSSIIVTSLKQVRWGEGVVSWILPSSLTSKGIAKEPTQIRAKKHLWVYLTSNIITKLGEPCDFELQIDSFIWLSHTLQFIVLYFFIIFNYQDSSSLHF